MVVAIVAPVLAAAPAAAVASVVCWWAEIVLGPMFGISGVIGQCGVCCIQILWWVVRLVMLTRGWWLHDLCGLSWYAECGCVGAVLGCLISLGVLVGVM